MLKDKLNIFETTSQIKCGESRGLFELGGEAYCFNVMEQFGNIHKVASMLEIDFG